MTEFEKNHPEQLREFLKQLNKLLDEFHPNIYTIDNVWSGVDIIEIAIKNELNK
jgi:Holliday junction resolvasome RuvABC endonuclease subunit